MVFIDKLNFSSLIFAYFDLNSPLFLLVFWLQIKLNTVITSPTDELKNVNSVWFRDKTANNFDYL